MHDAAGRPAAATHACVEFGVRFHVADFVRQNEMVEPIQCRRELTPVVGRVQDIGIRAQKKSVTSRFETLDQSGDRLVEPEDVLPGLDKFVIGQISAPREP